MDKKYKYRFKTEEEFIREFGPGADWGKYVECTWIYQMDYLFGTVIDIENDVQNKGRFIDYDSDFNITSMIYVVNRSDFQQDYWIVSASMVKKVYACPSYEPKKFIYA